MASSLQRFLSAQATTYKTAHIELSKGRKESHWMWFIFPQIQGLGLSETAKHYAIRDLDEAAAFMHHPVLGPRLIAISEVLLGLESADASYVFGSPDDLKLKSSMTLFAALPDAHPVFQSVLQKFFDGEKDRRTLTILATEG